VEAPRGSLLDDVCAQHQMFPVRGGDDDALLPGQAGSAADVEEGFDLFIDAAHRLHLPLLIDRPGDGDALADG
jgi:hypothetical protein